MASTFLGIEIAKKGIMAHSQALNTAGHNLSNLNNEDYSRQRVVMSSFDPLYVPDLTREQRAGQIGQGVSASIVERVRDDFIDDRIVTEKATLGFYNIREGYLQQIEHVYNEPAEGNMPSLSRSFDEFVKAWNDIASNPTDRGSRQTLQGKASQFTKDLNAHYNAINEIRLNVDRRLRTNVETINNLASQIVKLNTEIKKSKAMGDNPNDLMDKRDALIEKLATLVDVNIQRGGADGVIVYIGAQHLIQGDKRQELAVIDDPENEALARVVWKSDNRDVEFNDGEMAGLIQIRDIDAKNKLRQLNSLAMNISETVNNIHREGFGLNQSTGLNFFKHVAMTRNARGNYDRNNDGTFDSTVLFRVTGLNKLSLHQTIGSAGILNLGRIKVNGDNILIRYSETDTVQNIIEKINKSDAGLSAYLDHNGRLTFKATLSQDRAYPDHVIRHIEDSGNLLVGFSGMLRASGAEGAYNWEQVDAVTKLQGGERFYTIAYKEHTAHWIALSNQINESIDNIAIRQGKDRDGDGYGDQANNLGDSRNANLIMSVLDTEAYRSGSDSRTRLDHNPVFMEKNNLSFREFMQSMIRELGTTSQDAKIGAAREKAILKSLENTRKSVSGVNIDEEMANMVKFQHGYSASARALTVMDKMLETIISLVR